MKIMSYGLFFIVLLFTGCSTSVSPVGKWNLFVMQNGKLEKMQTPETIMEIREDGTFVCHAKESASVETNEGKWKQKGEKIIFSDTTGDHVMIMTDDDLLTLEDQPFEKNGIRLMYLPVRKNGK